MSISRPLCKPGPTDIFIILHHAQHDPLIKSIRLPSFEAKAPQMDVHHRTNISINIAVVVSDSSVSDLSMKIRRFGC